jgi:hypothetical protein
MMKNFLQAAVTHERPLREHAMPSAIPDDFLDRSLSRKSESYGFRTATVSVPDDFDADQVPIPVNRAEKRITLVACICLDGSFTKPMVVIPRHPFDNDLLLLSVSESNCHI